jgi:competence protein ComEC
MECQSAEPEATHPQDSPPLDLFSLALGSSRGYTPAIDPISGSLKHPVRSATMKTTVCNVLAVILATSAAVAQMSIHLTDVGQADSILLEFKKAAVLIDAGGESTGDDRDKDHLLAQLNSFFTRRADLNKTLYAVIVSHPHIDHTKLLMDVFQNFKVKYFYDGGDLVGSGVSQLKKARTFATTHGIKYLAIDDDTITKNGFTPAGLKLLMTSSSADIRFLTGTRNCDNQNNNSLVVRVKYKDTTALFTGDSQTDGDGGCDEGQVQHLLDRYHDPDLLKADIYKVGHHGSFNATDEEFETAMSPKIALISAGHKETKGPGQFHGFYFGHPREDVVALLEATADTRTPARTGYTYTKGTKKKTDTSTIDDPRTIGKAIYCTCWDKDVDVDVNAAGDQISVTVAP